MLRRPRQSNVQIAGGIPIAVALIGICPLTRDSVLPGYIGDAVGSAGTRDLQEPSNLTARSDGSRPAANSGLVDLHRSQWVGLWMRVAVGPSDMKSGVPADNPVRDLFGQGISSRAYRGPLPGDVNRGMLISIRGARRKDSRSRALGPLRRVISVRRRTGPSVASRYPVAFNFPRFTSLGLLRPLARIASRACGSPMLGTP